MRYLLVLLLGGCAYSPQELSEAGQRVEYRGELAPAESATCMARNTESFTGMPGMRYAADVRSSGAGAYDVVVRSISSTIVYALVAPSPGGATITMWLYPQTPYLEDLAAHMAKGC